MRRRGKREAGQALVLGALLLLVVAGTLLATLNLGNAVHERIRLQNAADAQAHGLAVLEARAFNLFAASNRALASAHVSLAAIHAYHSATSFSAALYDQTFVAIEAAAVAEKVGHGGTSSNPNPQGDLHGGQTAAAGLDFGFHARARVEQIAALDTPFRSTVEALERLIDGQVELQEAMEAFVTRAVVQGGGETLQPLGSVNAPRASFDDRGASQPSAVSLARVFERSADKKAAILREISNGSRWGGGGASIDPACNFVVNRGDVPLTGGIRRLACNGANLALFHPTMVDINRRITLCEPENPPGAIYGGSKSTAFEPGGYEGTALLGDTGSEAWDLPDSAPWGIRRAGRKTSILAADQNGTIRHVCFDRTGTTAVIVRLSAELETAPAPGAGLHDGPGIRGDSIHSGTHRWKGLTTRFMEFQPVSKPAGGAGSLAPGEGIDGQPVTYVVARQDLRLVERDDGRFSREKAWETNAAGELRLGNTKLGLVPAGQGFAIAKAMAYYHRPGAWKEGPNFWFPYWRAKLHPLTEREARQLARVAGPDAAEAAAAAARAIGGPGFVPLDPRAAR